MVTDSVLHPQESDTLIAAFSASLDSAEVSRLEIVAMERNVDTVALTAGAPRPDWHDGLEPTERNITAGLRSGFLLVIALMFIVLAFNFHHLKRLSKQYVEELTKLRTGRENIFDDRPAGDNRLTAFLVLQCLVSIGIVLTAAVSSAHGAYSRLMTVPVVGATILIVIAYFIFKYCAYQTVGYTFGGKEQRQAWIRAFFASRALLGLVLAVPAVIVIFYPNLTGIMSILALSAYFIAQIAFIYKVFRIFYDKITGLLYFILYLCTLEIIPLVAVYNFIVTGILTWA